MTKETSTSGPVLYCAYVACIFLYWPFYLAVRSAFKHFNPELYDRLKREDMEKKFRPFLMMMVRGILGVCITLPACAVAAYTTPAGLNHPLNVAGQVCVATQTTVWAVEIPWILEYSPELFAHHLVCLGTTANLVLSPTIHQLKPIFIFFTSQLGDLGPSAVAVTKLTGRRPATSNLMYYVALASTTWIMVGKVGSTASSIGMALENPYRIGDWAWGFCLTFFVFYHTYAAWRNFTWLGLIKNDEKRPYRKVLFKRFSVPISHLWLGLACAITMVSTVFVYSLYSAHAVSIPELANISSNGLLATAVGLTNAVILRIGSDALFIKPGGYSRDLCLQYGILCAAIYTSWASYKARAIDGQTAIAAGAFSVPLLQVVSGIASHFSVKENSRRQKPSSPKPGLGDSTGESTQTLTSSAGEPVDNNGVTQRRSTKSQRKELFFGTENIEIASDRAAADDESSSSSDDSIDFEKSKLQRSKIAHRLRLDTIPKNHLNIALSNLVIFGMMVVILLTELLDFSEAAMLAVSAALLTQLHSVPVLELFFGAYAVIALNLHPRSFTQVAVKLGVLGATLAISNLQKDTSRPPQPLARPNPQEGNKKRRPNPLLKVFTDPMAFTVLAVIVLQSIMAREVYLNPDYSSVEETPIGWKNFRTALTSPRTWIGAVFTMTLPVFGLGIANF